MDGLLIIDKPVGPTSHDVVARVRRVLREARVGHTGTLDPGASGVLPLVIGRATRLAQFLSAAQKHYEAVVRLGIETDSYDRAGVAVGSAHRGPAPTPEAIDRALDAFRGTFLQEPPAFSAKKVDGRRSYRVARARARRRDVPDLPALPVLLRLPAPVSVTAHAIDIVSIAGDQVVMTVECSAGFYVRSLAHDLGKQLGTGAHLLALKRTKSGEFTLEDAITLEGVENDPREAAARVIPLERMLPNLPAVVLSPDGVRRAVHGRDLGQADADREFSDVLAAQNSSASFYVRLLDVEGRLVGVATRSGTPGLLHPSVVLM